jgi:hypothetical protein
VLTFSPITCRWFEAAASGAVVTGKAPQDAAVEELFGPDFVVPLDHTLEERELTCAFEELWANRERLLARALARREALSHQWSWGARVREMLGLLGLQREGSPAPAGVGAT